jgi:thermitase
MAAAGNSGVNNDATPHYPSSYDNPNVVSVAATDSKDVMASFSNYGATSVDLAAPGVSIYSTLPGNTYGYKSGTSMATPHAARVAALIKSNDSKLVDNDPDLDKKIKDKLIQSVDLTGLEGKTVSGGRLSAARAVGITTVS